MTRDLQPADLWDPVRENEHQEHIERELYRLLIWLRQNAGIALMDGDLVRRFHRQVFRAVFPTAAGLVRRDGCRFDVGFGPHVGAPYQECEARFQGLAETTLQWIELLDRDRDNTDSVVTTACAHHAEFIALHPFVDGNGRIGRVCANYFAARYGLQFVEVYRTEPSDYERALTIYIREKRLAPLVEYWRPYMKPA